MSTTRKYVRRSRQQWAELIELQPSSGLSVPHFCQQAGVSYPSFMAWRKKLRVADSVSNNPPGFVELTSAADQTIPGNTAELNHWQVELDLGNGIQLRIAQH